MNISFYVEIALCVLLASTLLYCVILERRLSAMRKSQDGLKQTIGELNDAITAAGTALRALKSTASGAADALDERITRARGLIDELSVVTASGERIADRIDRAVQPRPAERAPDHRSAAPRHAMPLPSGSIMGRLDALRAVR